MSEILLESYNLEHLKTSGQVTATDPEERKKQEWAIHMRKKFSPKDMLVSDGGLNLDYFRPRPIKFKKWTDSERDLLIQGIEKYGIGDWENICNAFLPGWLPNEMRSKTSKMMGRQSLVEYIEMKWQGNKAEIEKEHDRNKEIGLMTGAWKGGLLIKDDTGLVKRICLELKRRKLAGTDSYDDSVEDLVEHVQSQPTTTEKEENDGDKMEIESGSNNDENNANAANGHAATNGSAKNAKKAKAK